MKEKPYVAGKLNTANGKAARREKEDSAEGHLFANANQASRGGGMSAVFIASTNAEDI